MYTICMIINTLFFLQGPPGTNGSPGGKGEMVRSLHPSPSSHSHTHIIGFFCMLHDNIFVMFKLTIRKESLGLADVSALGLFLGSCWHSWSSRTVRSPGSSRTSWYQWCSWTTRCCSKWPIFLLLPEKCGLIFTTKI